MAITRVTSGLYGGRLAGSFAGKTATLPSTHPVGEITRVVSGMWGGRRAGSFTGKASTDQVMDSNYILRARRLSRR